MKRELTALLNLYRDLGAEFLTRPSPSVSTESRLHELHRQIEGCRKCRLHESKTHYVPGEGSVHPDIFFIGEGPGETEDKFGRPFIGKAGQLLDKIILKMGYTRESVFIGNIVKCRPPNNREPQKDEADACLPYLIQQIEILSPKVIVCLGRIALNFLLEQTQPIGKVRGQQFTYQGTPLIPTYHPSYILHKKESKEASQAKWEVWEDMQKVIQIISGRQE